ncbi:hypothetical protein ACOMHN_020189 [Nucella lapillus]
MKFFIACFAAVIFVAMAEDVFFHDKDTQQIVWRQPASCHVMATTQEQQDYFFGHDYILVLKQLMRDLSADAANTSPLPSADVTDFITHHCHGRQVVLITQPTA